jgi:hypothetical protein
MKYIFYTTSKSALVKQQADYFAKQISQTKGREEVEVEVVVKKPFKKVKTTKDNDGDTKFVWSWFRDNLPKKDYDGVIFHFTPYYRRLWGITESLNGVRNENNREHPEFWVCTDLDTKAKGYPDNITNFLRLLFHEHAHFDEDLDDEVGNVLTQMSVHKWDYELKQIHKYHLMVDYRGRAFKNKVNQIFNKVIKLAKQYV